MDYVGFEGFAPGLLDGRAGLVRMIRAEEPFRRMGSQVGQTIESYGRPNNAVLEACRELGRQLAHAV